MSLCCRLSFSASHVCFAYGKCAVFLPRYGQAKEATASLWRRKTGSPSSNLWKRAHQLRWECIHTTTHARTHTVCVEMQLIGLIQYSHTRHLVAATTRALLQRLLRMWKPANPVKRNNAAEWSRCSESLSATLQCAANPIRLSCNTVGLPLSDGESLLNLIKLPQIYFCKAGQLFYGSLVKPVC